MTKPLPPFLKRQRRRRMRERIALDRRATAERQRRGIERLLADLNADIRAERALDAPRLHS